MKVDENAIRLKKLREFLDDGLSLAEAVKATNEYFKKLSEQYFKKLSEQADAEIAK